jgi:microcystin-dependent protein
LGEVRLTAASVGVGVPAAGQILSIQQNQALFSLLGTRFGGNGTTTFALPDLRSAAPNDLTYMICIQGIFPARN